MLGSRKQREQVWLGSYIFGHGRVPAVASISHQQNGYTNYPCDGLKLQHNGIKFCNRKSTIDT